MKRRLLVLSLLLACLALAGRKPKPPEYCKPVRICMDGVIGSCFVVMVCCDHEDFEGFCPLPQ